MNWKLTLVGGLLMFLPLLNAQENHFLGTEFMVPFLKPNGQMKGVLEITSPSANCLLYIEPDEEDTIKFEMKAGELLRIHPDTFASYGDSAFWGSGDDRHFIPAHRANLLLSQYPVTAILEFHNTPQFTEINMIGWTNPISLIPKEHAGKFYRLHTTSYVEVLSHSNANSLRYDLISPGAVISSGDTVITVNRFEGSYETILRNYGSGSVVEAKSPIYVTSTAAFGNRSECISMSTLPRRRTVNMTVIPDTAKAGVKFFALPYKTQKGVLKLEVMPNEPNTWVWFNSRDSVLVDTLGMDTCLAHQPWIIESDKPISLSQYHVVPAPDPGQPAYSTKQYHGMREMLLHNRNFIQRSQFAVDRLYVTDSFFLNLVCRTVDTAAFLLDGQSLSGSGFKPFAADSSMSWVQLNIKEGVHNVVNPGGFIGYTYGMYLSGNVADNDSVAAYMHVLPGMGEPEADTSFHFATTGQVWQTLEKGDTLRLCRGDSLKITPPYMRHTTWRFEDGSGGQLEITNTKERPDTFITRYTSEGIYRVSLRSLNWCQDTADAMYAYVHISSPEDAVSATLRLEETCEGNTLYTQVSGAADSYTWMINGSEMSHQRAPEIPLAPEDEKLNIQLIYSIGNCSDSIRFDRLISQESTQVEIPNIITPNGDGINDCFSLNLTGAEGCYSIHIYSRWGSLLYKSNDPEDCWNANQNAAGVYFYIIQIRGREYTGSFTVVR